MRFWEVMLLALTYLNVLCLMYEYSHYLQEELSKTVSLMQNGNCLRKLRKTETVLGGLRELHLDVFDDTPLTSFQIEKHSILQIQNDNTKHAFLAI